MSTIFKRKKTPEHTFCTNYEHHMNTTFAPARSTILKKTPNKSTRKKTHQTSTKFAPAKILGNRLGFEQFFLEHNSGYKFSFQGLGQPPPPLPQAPSRHQSKTRYLTVSCNVSSYSCATTPPLNNMFCSFCSLVDVCKAAQRCRGKLVPSVLGMFIWSQHNFCHIFWCPLLVPPLRAKRDIPTYKHRLASNKW